MKQLLGKGSTILLLGTGGVGKTTVAAALGLAAAARHLNTALITVDPSRRLRDALGLERLGGKPMRLGAKRLREAGLDPSLRLSAMVLDAKGTWDTLVKRLAANPATRERILANPFYRSLTGQFAGSEAYAALQQLYDLHNAGGFDIEIVDTPPAAHAFDFLQAPARLARLLDSRAARWLFTPYVSAGQLAMKLASRAARFVVRELERFAGTHVLAAVSEFFSAAAEALDSVVDQLGKTEALLHSPRLYFVLVTTPEEDRLRQARNLISEMEAERLHLSAVVINRFLDEETWAELANSGNGTTSHFEEIGLMRSLMADKLSQDPRLDALVRYLEDYRDRTRKDIARVARFARSLPPSVRLAIAPEIEVGVRNLRSLSRVANFIAGLGVASQRHQPTAASLVEELSEEVGVNL